MLELVFTVNTETVGFSAGGVLAAHLAFCYPDIFSGVINHSAAPYKALKGILPGEGPEKLGEYAYRCARVGIEQNKLRTVMVFHGTRDHIAPFFQGYNVIKQAYDFFDLMDDQNKNASMLVSAHERTDGFDVYLKKNIQIHYYAIGGTLGVGGAIDIRFSSPNTMSSTQMFYETTEHFGSRSPK